MRLDVLDRVVDKISVGESCWEWTGARTPAGYGNFMVRTADGRKTLYAHRFVYEWLVGPIPEGLHIDHLCRNQACVNPAHLEPVTCRENGRRGIKGELTTHCPRGHEYTAANTRMEGATHRHCRACQRERDRGRKR